MKRIFLIAFCIIMIFALVGCGGKPNVDENMGKQEEQQKDKVYGIGEYAKTEHYEVAIAKVTKPTKWKFEPEEGKEYVAVEISIKNISDEDGSVKQSDFQYMEEDEKLHGRYPDTYSGFDVTPETFGAEDLEIGQTFNGTIVYLLPKSMTEVELWYREGYTTKPDATFKFSK